MDDREYADIDDDVEIEDDKLPTPSSPANISRPEPAKLEEAEDGDTEDSDEGGEQEELASPEDAEAIDPRDIPLVDRETGEEIDPALRQQANADLAARGLDYDVGEYSAAISVLEQLPEDAASSQAFLEAAL